METPQVDGNEENQEKADKKIIGRGFRPALKTPKNFPYPLELDQNSQPVKLEFDEKYNRLYICDIEQAKTISVEIHPRGLRLMVNQKKYIIPGELSLAKTVDLLAKEYNSIKKIVDDPDVKEKFTHPDFTHPDGTRSYADLAEDAEKQIKLLALKHRKREIAGALLANNLWQKRGFIDKEKIAPKNFWQVVPVEEIIIGDKHNLEKWWENSLAHSLMNSRGYENYDKRTYRNFEYDRTMEMQELVGNRYHLTEKKYAAKIRSYRMHEIIEKNALLKTIRDKIKEGFFPEYPWEIRHWDKISFEPFKKALLYGLHKMPEWEAYIKSGAPQIDGIIGVIQSGLINEDVYDEKNIYDIKQEIKKFEENKSKQRKVFFQPLKTEVKEKIRQSLALFTEGKILEGKCILTHRTLDIQDKNGEYYNLWDTKEYIIHGEILVERKDFIDIFKEERKDQFVIPDFACTDRWEWDKNKISLIALKIIRDQEEKYYLNSLVGIDYETMKKTERDRIDNTNSITCIAIKNENGIRKEAVLSLNPFEKYWYPMGYLNCNITDLREIKIFCRTLNVIKKELKPKINTDIITSDIQKERVIENSLLFKSFTQSNKIGGR